ncbi:hypothetical protein PFICI_11221 [Pestalotiopsis fici W106-1]|uniref:CENP-V/GFA domain-containing protein n=1 Tax=Pestalotiopsis fici (strain W106-1 / CGMCC3.15140) TaxID=1229662 RepID=W3WW57_PESFW|nr:uncharacterized protein PFICI_11221 [Pestalotiopsis fici W106-1]ETS77347.1 hypothetical protein PFICI_11221 [Pestalotiopsis fici W106-1]
MSSSEDSKPSETYQCGCHCGYIKFSMTISPPLTGQPAAADGSTGNYKVTECNCSACARFGYLLVYPPATAVTWSPGHRERCAEYEFNTKSKDQLFCPKCGASLGIDFRAGREPHTYGISARTIYGINLDDLTLKKLDGIKKISPAGDLSGNWWDEEKQEMK